MLGQVIERLNWIEGESLILSGEARRGISLLREADRPSLRWQLALPVMRMFPAVAAPLLRLRTRLAEPSRR